MKKKEREHLKEDPFQVFIQKVLAFMKDYKKEIYAGLIAVAAAIAVIFIVDFIRTGSISSENERLSAALVIEQNDKLSVDEKIEQLSQLESKRGISATIRMNLASLYFQKGDLAKTKEILANFDGSKYRAISDKKALLEAEILYAEGKQKEAVDQLYKIFADGNSEIAKDFLLLRMARIQAKADQLDQAKENLKKITEDFPQSAYRFEAQTLLTKLEN